MKANRTKLTNVAKGISVNRKVGEYVRGGGRHINRSIAYWRRQYWGGGKRGGGKG
jgi:hypothetical protein